MLINYTLEFVSLINEISHRADTLQLSTKERKAAALEESKEQLAEAEDLLNQMDHEIVSINGPNKQIYLQKIKKLKQDFEDTKIKVSKMEYQCKLNINKETAMGWHYDPGTSNDHNRFLLGSENHKENKEISKLHDPSKIWSDAEVEARDIELNFNNGRDLASEGRNIIEMNGVYHENNKSLSFFRKHEMVTRALLLWIIVMFLIGVLVIGYFILN